MLLLTVLVLLALFALLLRGASVRYLREDEAIAFAGTAGDLASTVEFQRRDVHAPLWFVAFHGWQWWLGMGDDELPSRLFSVLLSTLTLAVTYRLGRQWFGTWQAGLCSLIALGTLAYFYLYGLEIRPYALVMLLAALSMWSVERWLRLGTWRSATVYALTIAAMLYLHYFGTFLVLMQGSYALVFLLWRRPDGWRRRLGQGITVAVLAFALWLPWLPTFVAQVRHISQLVTAAEARAIQGLGMASTTLRTDWQSLSRFAALTTNGMPLLYGGIAIAGLLLLWRRRHYWLVVAWGLGVPGSMFALNLLVPVYEPRYASTLVPGVGLLLGVSLAALLERAVKAAPRLRLALFAIVTAAFAVAAALTAPSGVPDHLPARDFLTEMQALHQPGDGIIFDHVVYELTGAYLYRKYAPSFLEVLRSEARANVTAAALSADGRSPRCVWFITDSWFTQAETTRQRFQQVAAKRPLQNVIGIPDRYLIQRVCAPPLVEPVVFGDTVRFLGAEVLSIADQRVTLKLWWDVLRSPPADYSFSVRLIAPDGTQVAQTDGPLTDFYGQPALPTSSLVPDVYYIDRREMTLAALVQANTPYALWIVVYQWWDGQRLPSAGGSDGLTHAQELTLTAPSR
jgi:hypothetical protein